MVHLSRICTVCALLVALAGCASAPEPQGNSEILNLQAEAEYAYQLALLDQAETLYLEILRSIPNFAPAWFRLGNIYSRTGRLDAAILAYERCVELEPENQKALYNMALVRLKQSHQIISLARRQNGVDPQVQRQIDGLYQALLRLQQHTPTDSD